ncbi:hypothetical protein NXY56_006029 [Leishmania guyanensis]|uniref:Uncharacterized protein n=2 Tax=Leishmania guyanensis species complex TaxID=38579 RepID=A0A1E1J4G0_LEIGU|nr:hypothetical protein, conserved [Leishmania guyanensis]
MRRCGMRCVCASPFSLTRRLLSDEDRYKQFSDILCKARASSLSAGQGDAPEFFDGRFQPGSGFLDSHSITQMQNTLRANLTPEMRDNMASMLQSALQGDGGMPGGSIGMMAFGMGENEKGKKVARAAKLSYDLKTGKVNKDFVEEQLEPDDISLPKETVEDYHTEGALEVEFVEDQKRADACAGKVETISAAEIEVEPKETTS